jgi:hypothetical protein
VIHALMRSGKETMKRIALILALSLAAAAYAATTSIIKVSRLSDTTAAISCKNGADPYRQNGRYNSHYFLREVRLSNGAD